MYYTFQFEKKTPEILMNNVINNHLHVRPAYLSDQTHQRDQAFIGLIVRFNGIPFLKKIYIIYLIE
jgi:hypothetical protein